MLAYFAAFFSAAVFLFAYLRPALLPLCLAGALLLAVVSVLCIRRNGGQKRVVRIMFTCVFAMLCGLLRSSFYEKNVEKRCEPYDGKTQIADMTVKGIPQSSERGYGVLTDYRGIDCYLSCDESFSYEAGEKIRVLASFVRTEDAYYLTAGIPLCAEYELEPIYLGKAEKRLRYLPAKFGGMLQNRIRTLFSPDSAALLLAILTGNRTQLNENSGLLADLRLCGASHSVAISGMHISYLVSLVYFLLGRRRYASVVCIPILFVFMAMTGFAPSVTRAGVMQLFLCVACICGRDYDSVSALFYAMLILLFLNPQCAKSAALQLSFAGTLGIVLFSERLENAFLLKPKQFKRLSAPVVRLHETAASIMAVAIGAMVFSVPLSLVYFGQSSLLAPLSSLLILWSVSFCFSIGLIAALLGGVFAPLAELLALPVEWLARYFAWAARLMGKIPLSVITTQTLWPLLWLLSFYGVIPLVLLCKRISHKRGILGAYIAVGFALSWGVTLLPVLRGEFRYALLDVGQGECAVISRGNQVMMIDCGGGFGRNAGDIAADYLGTMCRAKVDALILTHYHSDHINGVEELLNRVTIKTAYVPVPKPEDEAAIALLSALLAADVRIKPVNDMEAVVLGELQSLIIPPGGEDEDNEACLAVWTKCGAFRAFTTGDAGFEAELAAAKQAETAGLDLLIVGHHGSEGSCSAEYLLYTQPKEAYISVGSNRYGLPSEETLERLRGFGIPVHRTDLEGTLIFRRREETR